MFFKDIAGHKAIKQKLIGAVQQNRVSHALLFSGPEGNGKLSLAIAFAQYLSCENKSENDSCGTCSSCLKYQKLIHPDLHFVFPVIKKKASEKPISDTYIKEWREFLSNSVYHGFEKWLKKMGTENQQAGIFAQESEEIIKKLNLKSYESEYKIMIIWMPEKMNISASNKLLKMIEEPPPKTILILVTEDSEKIIKTILSRTQLIKIPKINEQVMYESIKEKYEIEDAKIKEIVRTSDGNYLKAEELILNNANSSEQENFSLFAQFMRDAYGLRITELIEWAEKMAKSGRETQKNFLQYALKLLRENFILNISPENQNKVLFLTDNEKNFSIKFNKFIHKNNIFQLTNEFNEAYNHIERNGYNKLIFLDLALKTARLLKIKPQ
ncbi:MAG: DNA polymerase III subunit delta [Bacteroidetes bacterium]|nr:MAG: DNA polymerase III subunit delta [Bacteroidota bacterium]